MSSKIKDYTLSTLIVVIAVIVIVVLDLPKGTSIIAVLIVIILSVILDKFREANAE
ncbi:hypothetical protein [uncultured Exiguobacterium sp.]|uniref:hypothetical protein n=1 Tax=uncultured Exiguobacterium sp. TaxID=202669 RepID=UPI0025EE2A4D|nr:hypothetical protein [uncultured Exiguobacterium sp.]